MWDNPGLVDFAIGLVNSVLHQNIWGLVEGTFGLVNASYSLPRMANPVVVCFLMIIILFALFRL